MAFDYTPPMLWWGRSWVEFWSQKRITQVRLPWWTIVNGNQQAQLILRFDGVRPSFQFYVWRWVNARAA